MCFWLLAALLFLFPNTFYPHFQTKAECYLYVRKDVTCYFAHNPESWEFFTIRFRLQCHSFPKLICGIYHISPNSSNYENFFEYLSFELEHIAVPLLRMNSSLKPLHIIQL